MRDKVRDFQHAHIHLVEPKDYLGFFAEHGWGVGEMRFIPMKENG